MDWHNMADVIDQQYTNTTLSNEIYIRNSATQNVEAGLRVIPTVTAQVSKFDFWIKKRGTPTGDILVKIYSETSDLPGTLLAISDTVDVSTVSTSYDYVSFTFAGANKIQLTSGTDYDFCLAGDYVPSSSDNVANSQHLTGSYASGGILLLNSGSWAEYADYDPAFKQYYDNSTIMGSYTSPLPAFRRP